MAVMKVSVILQGQDDHHAEIGVDDFFGEGLSKTRLPTPQ